MIRTILVPTDFSEAAAEATARAFDLAAALGAKIHLLHAYGIPPVPDAMGMGGGVDLLGPIEEAATRELTAVTERYRQRPEFAAAQLKLGDALELILDQAKRLPADLIVMGTHGRRGFQHLVLGSVAEAVPRHAPCPVLVVPQAKVRPR
jgi:nucleotide-binding universal stress UspA family protein